MKKLLPALAVLLLFVSCKNNVVYDVPDPVYHTGDNMLWATTHFPDTAWAAERGSTGRQIFWIRNRVDVKGRTNTAGPLGVQINSFGAFEVYWDGVLIGRNGSIAINGKPEKQGTETSNFPLPDSLALPGKHLLALRVTQSCKQEIQRGINVKVENYRQLLRLPLIVMSFMNLMAGAFFIASIYYFFLFVNSRRKDYSTLIFAVTCLLFFALLILEYLKYYVDIPYDSFYMRLEGIGWLTFLIAFLVPAYFTIQFSFKQKKLLLPVLLFSLIAIYLYNFHHYDRTAVYYSYAMWVAALIIVGNAIIQKEKGGIIVLAGLFASAVINYFLVHDFGLFISFMIIVLCMLYLHSIRARVIEEEYQASLQLSSKLQLELLKKNIQPHFIRNTLTSMIDWVEESPKQGAEFIQALAGEFDIMNAIAEETLIPVRQEIDLCRRHLSVMQFRKELRYEWKEEGIDENEELPPAVLHTIVENGITHSIPLADGSVQFKLMFERGDHFKQYKLETTAENRIILPGRKGGTGFRYITARLTESYGHAWEFYSAATATGWLSTIKIFQKS